MQIVATVHAIVASIASVYGLALETNTIVLHGTREAILYGQSDALDVLLPFGTAYFIYDFVINVYYWKKLKKTDVLLHHVVVLLSFAVVMESGGCAVFLLYAYIAELSDLFSHFAWLLKRIPSLRDTLTHGILEFFNLTVFIIVRFGMNGYATYRGVASGSLTSGELAPSIIFVLYMAFFLINVLWVTPITRRTMSTLEAATGKVEHSIDTPLPTPMSTPRSSRRPSIALD